MHQKNGSQEREGSNSTQRLYQFIKKKQQQQNNEILQVEQSPNQVNESSQKKRQRRKRDDRLSLNNTAQIQEKVELGKFVIPQLQIANVSAQQDPGFTFQEGVKYVDSYRMFQQDLCVTRETEELNTQRIVKPLGALTDFSFSRCTNNNTTCKIVTERGQKCRQRSMSQFGLSPKARLQIDRFQKQRTSGDKTLLVSSVEERFPTQREKYPTVSGHPPNLISAFMKPQPTTASTVSTSLQVPKENTSSHSLTTTVVSQHQDLNWLRQIVERRKLVLQPSTPATPPKKQMKKKAVSKYQIEQNTVAERLQSLLQKQKKMYKNSNTSQWK
ncbi:hypothetical protein FGO68_gene35 [Halteria grandinella]|uniref:Uncharacterized protein n=1 Tax=Halteria grandinella TaxID=5974 RepID=A0A8J8T6D4_HALGN|nr:hypothetical protein FGO68_gene35 [Halteria grandinella]